MFHLTTTKNKLLPLIMKPASVIENKQVKPILENLLLRIENGILTVTGTDSEIQIQSNVSIIDGGGRITVNAKTLVELVKSLPDDFKITMKEDGVNVSLKSGRSNFKLKSLPANNYPSLPQDELPYLVNVNSSDLKSAIDSVAFNMGDNSNVRKILIGLSFSVSNNIIKLTASDSFRAGVVRIDIAPTGLEESIVIPKKAVAELSKILPNNSDVILSFSNNSLLLTTPDTLFSTKLLDGSYPSIDRVFSKPIENTIRIRKDIFLSTLYQASILSNQLFKGTRLEFNNGQLNISAWNPEQEESDCVMDVDFSGALSASFNAKSLMEAVAKIPDDVFYMDFPKDNPYCQIKSEKNEKLVYIVMPMTL